MRRHVLSWSLRTALLLPAIGLVTSATAQQPDATQKSPQELLDSLRDVHLPAPPSLWPLAPGWWVLGLLNVLAVVYLCYKIFFRKPVVNEAGSVQSGWRVSALAEHRRINDLLSNGVPASQVVGEVSVLLRRVALARRPHDPVASMQSTQWLALLDELSHTDQYSHGVGCVLLEHPYKKHSELNTQQLSELLALVRKTIATADNRVADV
jgi:hypothetical protein